MKFEEDFGGTFCGVDVMQCKGGADERRGRSLRRMQEDGAGTREVAPSSSNEEWKLAEGYESSYESRIRDSIKEKRIKARFESIDVVAVMGKSKKNRTADRKINRERTKDDATVETQGESGKLGDLRIEREMRELKKIYREENIDKEKSIKCETGINEREKDKQIVNVENQVEGGQGQTKDKEIGESRISKGTKMIKYEGRFRCIENIKNYEEVLKSQN